MDSLQKYFRENFTERGELGASVSVWKNGEEIISLSDGFRDRGKSVVWTSDTLIPVYSATKAPAAATLLHALEKRGLNEESLVSEVWSGFPLDAATFAEMLSHQCGLSALRDVADVHDHAAVIAAVESQEPEWVPGQGHGYHPRTIGFLMDECVRRLEGKTLGEVWNNEIAAPFGIDFWIGLSESEFSRVAQLVPGRTKPSAFEEGFYASFHTADSLTRRAFSSPKGLHAIAEMNDPKAWQAGLPAMGGVGTASGLAKFYQAAIGAIDSPFSETTRSALATLQISGEDKVLL
jgi:CubicO group peptidase (beta-lactamase class C family)